MMKKVISSGNISHKLGSKKVNVMHNGLEKEIAAKINHILTIFPRLSHAMIQVGLGTSLPVRLWRPILDEMIAEGTVIVEDVAAETPAGRKQQYTVFQLGE